jgi:hypothetical protein
MMRRDTSVCKVASPVLAGLAFLLSTAALVFGIAAGIGVWIVKEPVTARATHIFERIEAALDIADKGLDHVKTSLANATARLDRVKQEQRKLAQEQGRNSTLGRLLARTVQQTIAPDLGNANEKLHTVAEAAAGVNSVLEDLGNFPLLAVSGLDLGRLQEINSRLAEVAPAAWELSRLLGDSGTGSDPDAAGTQLSRVEQALKTMQGWITAYEPRFMQVRQQVEGLKAMTLPWITPATVVVSLVCLWIALSQVSVLCHAWSWWRHSGHEKLQPS